MKLQLPTTQGFKRQEERNVCEQIEFAMLGKEEQFIKFLDRIFSLTSDEGWSGEVLNTNKGWYISLKGTRASFSCFLDENANVIRKPKDLQVYKSYDVAGNGTRIERIYL